MGTKVCIMKYKIGDLVMFQKSSPPREKRFGHIYKIDIVDGLIFYRVVDAEHYEVYSAWDEDLELAKDSNILDYLSDSLRKDLIDNYAETI